MSRSGSEASAGEVRQVRAAAARQSASAAAAVLELRGAAAALGGRRVWWQMNLSVQPGEFVAVPCPNGAGKSTLLKLILGLLPAHRHASRR